MCFLEFCHKYSAYSLSVSSGALFSHMTLFCTGYAADGSRLVAGVVAISSDKKKVLVVESTNRKNHWVLPKGGYETDEASAEEAAARKITLFFHYSIPFFPHPRGPRNILKRLLLFFFLLSVFSINLSLEVLTITVLISWAPVNIGEAWEEAGITGNVGRLLGEIRDKRTPRALYYFFEFRIEREESEWPEMHKRKRCWLTYKEATECFKIMNRPELQEAIDRSSLSR